MSYCENQVEYGGIFTGLLWGASYSANFDLDQRIRADQTFIRRLADGFAQIECLDLRVNRINLEGDGPF